tara:strand:- start:1988 stop:2206 length:219 start_codon:yes stop_codon:yes gene_type:complete
MTSEEQLWWRFKDIQDKVNSLSSIVQNPLGDYKVPAKELATWIDKANQTSSELGRLALDTYSFLEVNNAKDI